MPSLQIRTDSDVLLSSHHIPATAVARLRAVVGGDTPTETATAVLTFVALTLRNYLLEWVADVERQKQLADVTAAVQTATQQAEADWPE